MKLIKAKPISYDYTRKRPYRSVRFVVIHYTGLSKDSAYNEVSYFKNGNTRQAGAHFFVDQTGKYYKSIPMCRTAWSVGGFFTKAGGAGSYYEICTNYNSVSIEMCDCASKDPSPEMKKSLKKIIRYIQRWCPNATTIIRHYDVNGKKCPGRMCGMKGTKGWERWQALLKYLGYKKGKKIK